jgi:hypothetical protein
MTTKQRQLLFVPEELVPFTEELFDREEEKAACVLWSILESRSPRKSDWRQVFNEGEPKKGPTIAPSIGFCPSSTPRRY